MESRRILGLLRRHESRNVTHVDQASGWPIVWDSARGCTVRDVDGRRYLDLTAAFGVAAAGHANPRVVAAARAQAGRLLHGMGDVFPHGPKAELLAELSRVTFGRWPGRRRAKSILTCSGSEAVEAAFKTARLATGRANVIAFEGAYHGLGYGALNATHREHFRSHFHDQLGGFVDFVPFPACETCSCRAGTCVAPGLERRMDALARRRPVGAVIVEPVQARGGIRVPPPGFLRQLRDWCDRNGALLILDEIYTGFGRTGRWFACEREQVVPDLICVGKALTGGFPMGACVGEAGLMDRAWPESQGEAIHTSTFLGHPVGCAMAVAQIREIEARGLPERAEQEGLVLRSQLTRLAEAVRGLRVRPVGIGLMAGLEVRRPDGSPAGDVVVKLMHRLLEEGVLVLPEGDHAEVLGLTPPLVISRAALGRAVGLIGRLLGEVAR